ncbi:MAG TPA: site-specific integrase [Acidimicrobiales bacterium]|nr:site-specific integrase [Acidimicrobiales bacterium]
MAAQAGEAFDDVSGEPLSWQPAPDEIQLHTWARHWLAEQWPEWAPRTRTSAVEAIARLVPLVVRPDAPAAPADLRAHLFASLRPGGELVSPSAERWLEHWSLALGQLSRPLLALVEQRLITRDDGTPLGPYTAARYRKVSRACVRRAVELEVLGADPWPPPSRGRSQRKATRTQRRVRVRSLPDPASMNLILREMVSHQPASRTYQVMTAVAYYAGLRPSEVVMLRRRCLVLPDTGWGRLEVTEADVDFDIPGEPKTGPRSVPIPPVLVETIKSWIETIACGPDDLIFRTRTGRRPTASNWSRSLHRALQRTGHPPMRLYDCRHAAATTWLRAGVPLGEVAKRLGHSVETLVSTYVGALQDDEAIGNSRIDAALAHGLGLADDGDIHGQRPTPLLRREGSPEETSRRRGHRPPISA